MRTSSLIYVRQLNKKNECEITEIQPHFCKLSKAMVRPSASKQYGTAVAPLTTWTDTTTVKERRAEAGLI